MKVDIHCDRCEAIVSQVIAHVGVTNKIHLPLNWKELRIGTDPIRTLCPFCVKVVEETVSRDNG